MIIFPSLHSLKKGKSDMALKGQIDIEQLLIWAYRQECVDREVARFSPRGPSAQPTGSLEQYMLLGTRVDAPSFATRALGNAAPPDAIVVHDTVLSLGEIWLEWRAGDEVEVWDKERAEAQGQLIEKQGGVYYRVPKYCGGGDSPDMVRLEQSHIVGVIIVHAKSGTRPDYYGDWLSDQRGRPAGDGAAADIRGRKRKKPEGPTADEVAHARAIYAAWHAALHLLALKLADTLQQFTITGPDAPLEPWQESEKKRITPPKCQK